MFGLVDLFKGQGCLGDFVVAEASKVYKKPSSVSFQEACCIPVAGVTALAAIESIGRVTAGSEVVINGCSGGVGLLAVQIAKLKGAVVTGVCSSAGVEAAKAAGCEHVVDYTKEDIIEYMAKSGKKYDLFFELSMRAVSFHQVKASMKPISCFLTASPSIFGVVSDKIRNLFASQRNTIILADSFMNHENFKKLADMLDAKSIKIEIAKVYPLSAVRDAAAALEKGKFVGKLVVDLTTN